MGDIQCQKNGWLYHVWGTSADPNTWFEQNTTVANAPQRQLRRREVEVEVKDEDMGQRAILQRFGIDDDDDDSDEEVEDQHLMIILGAGGGDDADDSDGSGGGQWGYKIEGPQEEVKKIQDEINSFCQNPQNFFVEIDIDSSVSADMIQQIKQVCLHKHGLVDVKILRA